MIRLDAVFDSLKRPRLLLTMAVSLVIAAFFVATQPITPQLSIVSSLAVVAFAMPSYAWIVSDTGWKSGLKIIGILGFYALMIESSAIATGVPYGDFVYNDTLGGKVFGLTPWTVAFAYPPILLLAFYCASRLLASEAVSAVQTKLAASLSVAGLAAIIAMACDVVLDPAAVRLGFWYWHGGGFFYNVPLVNFGGWLISSFLGLLILQRIYRPGVAHPRLAYSGVAIIWFWSFINLWLGQWLPAIAGMVMIYGLWRLLRIVPGRALQ